MIFKEKQSKKDVMDDEKIIELYWNRDQTAIEETDHKYRKYLLSVAYNVLHQIYDCEECVNDTYLGVWNTIPPTRPRIFKAFITTIVRRISLKRYHSNLKKKAIPSEMTVSLSELEDFISGNDDVSSEFDSERLGAVISEFVRSLSERNQYIFMSRYYMSEPIEMIAKELKLSRSTINKELAAIRSALKEKLESEGYSV